MATSSTHSEQNHDDCHFRYEYEFVQPPPVGLQTDCSICLMALRSPHLTSCCGHNFCKECIENVQKAGNGCPLCNATEFTLVYNRAHHGTLNLLEVYCTHRKSGCEWRGNLEMLEKHLNVDSEPGTQLEGCEYVEVKCRYKGCGQSIKRHLLRNHQSKECPQRLFGCEHCNNYTATFHDVTTSHWPVCGCYPISCPNNCTPNKIQRQELERHLSEECPLQKAECEFKPIGCEAKFLHKDMHEHISSSEGMVCHMSLLAQQVQRLNEQNVELNRKNLDLTKQLQKLNLLLEFTAPVQIVMTDFEQRKQNRDRWYSEGFYTHPGGYKMCLWVDANGMGDGIATHVSCFVCMMRGQFDNTLKWPFRGNITIQLLNQQADNGHHTKSLILDKEQPDTWNSRVICGNRATDSRGFSRFITHGELEHRPHCNCQYLMNDTLCFRVEVELL